MRAHADSLFHFTQDLKTLLLILDAGFWPRYRPEETAWRFPSAPWPLPGASYPMVCFCDIPLSKAAMHAGRYGQYAIGLTREWGIRSGVHPVWYFGNANEVNTALSQVSSLALSTNDRVAHSAVFHLMAMLKPLHGHSFERIDGGWWLLSEAEVDFYEEMEWRYVPRPEVTSNGGFTFAHFLPHTRPTDLDQERTRAHMLTFDARDIVHILVPDGDIPTVMRAIEKLDILNDDAKYTQMSRVTSLQRIFWDA
jgi:hypothetical protein